MVSLIDQIAEKLGLRAQTLPVVERTEEGYRSWLTERMARALGVDAADVDRARRFDEFGVDSRLAIRLSGELETLSGCRLSPAFLFEHPTIDEVARALTVLSESPPNECASSADW